MTRYMFLQSSIREFSREACIFRECATVEALSGDALSHGWGDLLHRDIVVDVSPLQKIARVAKGSRSTLYLAADFLVQPNSPLDTTLARASSY